MLDVIESTDLGWSAGLFRPLSSAVSADLVAFGTLAPLYIAPGRAHYDGQRLRHRVSVFDRERRLVAALDAARFHVQDLAFHPEKRRLAIATGSYDGGYAYEGELLVWDIATGEIRRPLALNREVRRVRWHEDQIVALLAPETDESDDTWGVTLDDRDRTLTSAADPRIRPATEASLGFLEKSPPPWDCPAHPLIRGVAFVGDRIAAVGDGALVTLWDRALRTPERVAGPAGQQIIVCGRPLVAAQDRDETSSLHTLRGELLRRFDRAYAFSTDGAHILARDVRYSGPRADLVLDSAARALLSTDLGHYDVFNHALRLDGGLWFLRGTPPEQHARKVLASVSVDGHITERMAWDNAAGHHMENSACAFADDVIAGYRVHHPHPGKGERFVERRAVGGASLWRTRLPCAPIALAPVPALGQILVATLDGRLSLLDAQRGTLVADTHLRLGGVDVAPTCLAVDGVHAAVGTLDGRVLLVNCAGRPQ